LDKNEFFQSIMQQLDWIEKDQNNIIGFINWQGLLNNAQRIMGNQIFTDMYLDPGIVKKLMKCICETMIQAFKKIKQKQEKSGAKYKFFTVSNCSVNMISPDLYEEFILPYDLQLTKESKNLGIHNCAWNANPYLKSYAKIPSVKYIYMGEKSILIMAKKLFPSSRRAIMYSPLDFMKRDMNQIKLDLERFANQYSPCDIVLADMEDGIKTQKILDFLNICKEISMRLSEAEG